MTSPNFSYLQAAAQTTLHRLLTPAECAGFATYARLLEKWNGVYNLVGPQALTELYSRHFPESLALLPLLSVGERMLDIGSGAGFPGMVLAMLGGGQWETTLLDSAEKRCRFLRELLFELKPAGVTVVHAPAESYARKVGGIHTTIVMRAVAETTSAVRLADPLLTDSGQVLLLKGEDHPMELERWSHASLSRAYHPPEVIRPPQWSRGVILRFRKVSRETC